MACGCSSYSGDKAPPGVITPARVFRARAFMTLIWAIPVLGLGFGLIGLPFGRPGKAALFGLISAAFLAVGRGYTGAQAVRKYPELFKSAE